jgi:hypothetical protein
MVSTEIISHNTDRKWYNFGYIYILLQQYLLQLLGGEEVNIQLEIQKHFPYFLSLSFLKERKLAYESNLSGCLSLHFKLLIQLTKFHEMHNI